MKKKIYASILSSLCIGLLTAVPIITAHAQSTIIISAKSQSETGQVFSFTSNIPGAATFSLTDNASFIPLKDVGVGGNNTIWAIRKGATPDALTAVYFRRAGSTSWTILPDAASSRLDVDQNGNAYMTGGGAGLYYSNGTTLTSLGGGGIVDVGVSAGTAQPVYVLAGTAPNYVLYRYQSGAYTLIPGITGSRLDVAPNGSIWITGTDGTSVSEVTVSGNTPTVVKTYTGQFSDVTVAADGTVWITNSGLCYRLVGTSFVEDPNSSGTQSVTGEEGGISAGSDGDTPFLTSYSGGSFNTVYTIRKINTADGEWHMAG